MKLGHLFLPFFVIFLSLFAISGIGFAQSGPAGEPQFVIPSPSEPSPNTQRPESMDGSITVTRVWTTTDRDAAPEQTSFRPGEGIRYYARIHNGVAAKTTAHFKWLVTGPCGSIAYWEGDLQTGSWTWWLPGRIPDNACPGRYTYRFQITYRGHTSSKSVSFDIYDGSASECSAESINQLLRTYNSRMLREDPHVGDEFLQAGRERNVDPRFMVAIAGAETTFGNRICTPYNPFNWFYRSWCDSPYASWQDAIRKVTNGVHLYYLERGQTSIASFVYNCGSHCYCKNCDNWYRNVRQFYQMLGGDPDTNDLTFRACGQESNACPTITQWKGEYWDNQHLSGSPRVCRNDGNVRFDWGGGSPDGRIPSDHFSARWTRRLHFDAGRYRFKTISDDGIRVWVDGRKVIDAWYDQPPTSHQGEIDLGSGDHDVKVEYYENGGGAVAKLWWERISGGSGPPNCPGRYAVEYFNNRSLSGAHAYATCEGWPINHDWGGGSPGHGVHNDNFSARWTGRAHIDAGNYTFIARADDGIRVWIDNQIIIDAWRDQPPTTYRVTRYINGGDHNIKVEYYEHGGGAVAQFRWERSSGGSGHTYEIIAKHSGKCLDVEGARQDNGVNVQQWACGGGPNQRWRLEDAGGGYYRIVAVHSGKCLDVAGGSRDNGANVIQWECHGGDNQLWRLEQHGDAFRIIPKHSGKALDVEGARQDNGANVQQWQFGGGPNQLWRLVRH